MNLACRISNRVRAGVAKWYALPVFGLSVAFVWWAFGSDAANFYISIVTAALLFVAATGEKADNDKEKKQLDAITEAMPDVDDVAIAREVG